MRFKELMAGLKHHQQAHRIVMEHNLWPLMLIPGLLSLLYFPLMAVVTFHALKPVTGYLHENWVPAFLQSSFTAFLLGVLVWVLGVYLGFLVFRNVIMVICSPLLGYLSETVEKVSGGIEPPKFSWEGAGKELLRAAGLSVLSLTISVGVSVLCLLVSLVPVLGAVFAFFVMTLVQSYLAGIGFADSVLERRRYTVFATLKFGRKHRPRLMGVGLGFLLLLAIPVAGWFLAPSYGIIAGTLAALESLSDEAGGSLPTA